MRLGRVEPYGRGWWVRVLIGTPIVAILTVAVRLFLGWLFRQ